MGNVFMLTSLQVTATFPKLSEHRQCFLKTYIGTFTGLEVRTFQLSKKAFQKLLCIKCICKQRIRRFAFNQVEIIIRKIMFFSPTKSTIEMRRKNAIAKVQLKENRNKWPRCVTLPHKAFQLIVTKNQSQRH
jgi:hypothetical protein